MQEEETKRQFFWFDWKGDGFWSFAGNMWLLAGGLSSFAGGLCSFVLV